MTQAAIVYETATHYVLRVDQGRYEVYRNGGVAAVRCASVSYRNHPARAFARAIQEADKRSEDYCPFCTSNDLVTGSPSRDGLCRVTCVSCEASTVAYEGEAPMVGHWASGPTMHRARAAEDDADRDL